MSDSLPKIALAAVLKPIDDTRMYEKFALTLCTAYEVHIIGFETSQPLTPQKNIHFHPLFQFTRQGNKRLGASKQLLHQLTAIQPDLLIIHAVELLPAACWYAWRHRIPLCYDVRENYWRNIIYQRNYSTVFKWPLAIGIRLLERLSRLVVQHYFLAEQCYATEFNFTHGKHTVLENKFKPLNPLPISKSKKKNELQFVYTGTISKIYGAQEAFNLMEKLRNSGLKLHFTMIGKVAQQALGNWLAQRAQRCPWFTWSGNSQPVPHPQILEALHNADYALLPYQPNLSTINCIPTKMYECLALAIPMVVQENELWKSICTPHQAAVFIDFPTAQIETLKNQLLQGAYYPNGPVATAFWEGATLLDIVHALLHPTHHTS
ncbi:MAG: hypothetical protein ACPGJS_16105 [Flammeovirgaceae bacterium]